MAVPITLVMVTLAGVAGAAEPQSPQVALRFNLLDLLDPHLRASALIPLPGVGALQISLAGGATARAEEATDVAIGGGGLSDAPGDTVPRAGDTMPPALEDVQWHHGMPDSTHRILLLIAQRQLLLDLPEHGW